MSKALSPIGELVHSVEIKQENYDTEMNSSPEYEGSGNEVMEFASEIPKKLYKNKHIINNGREARNRAEKIRRDKLNGSIQELSTVVPHVAESSRRMDKTAVLRFSAHGLRVRYVFGKTLCAPPKLQPQVTESLMELLGCFLLTITCRGQIVLVSPGVEQHLGHCQTDLFGQNIFHITHPDDHLILKKQIIPTLFSLQLDEAAGGASEGGEPRLQNPDEEHEIDRRLKQDKRNFSIRVARAGPRSEPTTYEVVKIDGCFRRADCASLRAQSSTNASGGQHLTGLAQGKDNSLPLHTISGNDIVFVAMARVIKPLKLSDRLTECSKYEYKTRHLIDGRIVQCDQRISLVAGYMTEEVNGLSPFTFMHQNDVRWVIVALRKMYDCNSAYGESCYRLMTRNGKFVYLRTRGYLEIDQDTNNVHSFICVNTLVSDDEGEKLVEEMKNKFSIIINTKIPASGEDAPAAENPHQLERAIIYLIENLQPPESNENNGDPSDINNEQSDHSKRHSKTPPLSIIPPNPCTIKSSITKSIKVVNTTASKCLRNKRSNKLKNISGAWSGSSDSGDNSNEGKACDRPSVLQRNENYSNRNIKNEASAINSENKLELTKVMIKEESDYEDNRVPPLPSSKDYFELSSLNDYSSFPSELSNFRTSTVLKRTNQIDDVNNSDTKRRSIGICDGRPNFNISLTQELRNPSADLIQLLPSSFEAIDRTLINIETATTELKQLYQTYSMGASSQDQIEEIIQEQQEERELLENIQSEFQPHLQNTNPVIPDLHHGGSLLDSSELKPR